MPSPCATILYIHIYIFCFLKEKRIALFLFFEYIYIYIFTICSYLYSFAWSVPMSGFSCAIRLIEVYKTRQLNMVSWSLQGHWIVPSSALACCSVVLSSHWTDMFNHSLLTVSSTVSINGIV